MEESAVKCHEMCTVATKTQATIGLFTMNICADCRKMANRLLKEFFEQNCQDMNIHKFYAG